MRLHEKTIELNLTRELLNLVDPHMFPLMHRRAHTRIYLILRRLMKPLRVDALYNGARPFAFGMHTNMEGQDTARDGTSGVDASIRTTGGAHALHVQFKRSEEATRREPALFRYKLQSHQHNMLEHLASMDANQQHAHMPIGKVVYALPQIRYLNELKANAGHLLAKTRFVSVARIGNIARTKEIDLGAGTHYICVNRIQGTIQVRSIPVEARESDVTDVVLADLAEARLRNLTRLINAPRGASWGKSGRIRAIDALISEVALSFAAALNPSNVEGLGSEVLDWPMMPFEMFERFFVGMETNADIIAVVERMKQCREYLLNWDGYRRELPAPQYEVLHRTDSDIDSANEMPSSAPHVQRHEKGRTGTKHGPVCLVFPD